MRKTVTPSDEGSKGLPRALARRNRRISEHLSLVDGIALEIHRRLPPSFDLVDLVGAGNIALTLAAAKYKPRAHPGVPFAAFARQRIRGAILDSVGRKKHRFDEQTRPSIVAIRGSGDGNLALDHEVLIPEAAALAVQPTVTVDIDAARMARRLIEAVRWLPPAQQRVLGMYYGAKDAPNQVETARRLGMDVKEVRAEHNAAIEELRRRFRRVA